MPNIIQQLRAEYEAADSGTWETELIEEEGRWAIWGGDGAWSVLHGDEHSPRFIVSAHNRMPLLLAVAEAAAALIDEGAPSRTHEYAGLECVYCGAVWYARGIEHKADCLWLLAKAALAPLMQEEGVDRDILGEQEA